MWIRRLITIGVPALLFLFFMFASKKVAQSGKETSRQAEFTSVKVVRVLPVQNGLVPSRIPLTGKLVASQKVAVISEVNGRMLRTTPDFKEGNFFGGGSALIKVDHTEAKINLLAQRSSFQTSLTQMMPDLRLDYPANAAAWQKYLDDFDVNKPLPALPAAQSEKEKYFLSARGISTQYFNIKVLEERLGKYTINAPFGGVVTASTVDPGTMIVAGQKLGEFSNPSVYELEASVGVSDLNFLKIGQQVALRSENLNQTFTGTIRRISDKIDPNTQTVRVFVAVSDRNLKEGMYLAGEIQAGSFENAFEIPRKLVEENEVFLVADSVLKRKPVEVKRITDKTAVVTGLANGEVLLNENIIGAFEGMKVKKAPNTPNR